MKGFVVVTDNDWCAFLSQQLGIIDEVNFWQPGGVKGGRSLFEYNFSLSFPCFVRCVEAI